ncbi:MAG: hypothetical protein NTV51_01600 [Verrucomicrobia bacterium]|nr:hypothetical protein [Verrucomicrobiota bacterium]
MRFISALFSLLGAIMFVAVLSSTGAGRPKALAGTALMTLVFGYHAARYFAFERKKAGAEFVAEKKRVLDILRPGADFETAWATLGASYRKVIDTGGVGRGGPCRVVDLSGTIADVRVEVRDAKIGRVTCAPKEDPSLGAVVATLKTEIPPQPTDLTPRDWMGNPVDRK